MIPACPICLRPLGKWPGPRCPGCEPRRLLVTRTAELVRLSVPIGEKNEANNRDLTPAR